MIGGPIDLGEMRRRSNVICFPVAGPRRAARLPAPRSLTLWRRSFLCQIAEWPLPLQPGQCTTLRRVAEQIAP